MAPSVSPGLPPRRLGVPPGCEKGLTRLCAEKLGPCARFGVCTVVGVGPAKTKPGYANFAVAEPPLKLVLLENPGKGGSINHLGVEVEDSAKVHAEIARFTQEGLFTDENGTTCCFATQDKVWVTGPGQRWEVYTVLADSDTFGSSPQTLIAAGQATDGGVCCATSANSCC